MKLTAALVWIALLLTSCGNQRTYAEGCGPLPKGWITPREGRGVLSMLSVISVQNDGVIVWNGKSVSEPTLLNYLRLSSQLNPVPVTQIMFAPSVDCDVVRRLRTLMVSNSIAATGSAPKAQESGGS